MKTNLKKEKLKKMKGEAVDIELSSGTTILATVGEMDDTDVVLSPLASYGTLSVHLHDYPTMREYPEVIVKISDIAFVGEIKSVEDNASAFK